MNNLPSELLLSIFANLERHEIVSLLSTCRRFSAIAKPLFYAKVDLTLMDERDFIEDFPDIHEDFPIDVVDTGRRHVVTEALLKRPDLLEEAPYSSYEDLFRHFRRWKHLSESEDAKFISSLSVAEEDSYCGPDERIDRTIDALWMVEPLLDNMAPLKITYLSIDWDWLFKAKAFRNLKELKITVTTKNIEQVVSIEGVEFPLLDNLKITGATGPLLLFTITELIQITSALICQFRTINSFAMSSGVSPDTSAVHDIYRDYVPLTKRVLERLILPNLQELSVSLNQETMHAFVSLPNNRQFNFYDMFLALANRHRSQLKRISWVGGFSPDSWESWHPEPVFENLNLHELEVSLHQNIEGPTGQHRDLEVYGRVSGNERCQQSLRELTLWLEFERPVVDDIAASLFAGFRNLTDLSIHLPEGWKWAMYRIAEYDDSALASIFGFSSEAELAAVLPKPLRKLKIEHVSFYNPQVSPIPSFFARVKASFRSLFEECTSLVALDFEVEIMKERVFTDVPNSEPIDPRPSEQISEKYVVRRRPYDYEDQPAIRKKICVWTMENMHEYVWGVNCAHRHSVLKEYCEYNLAEKEFLGVDGEKWVMDTKEAIKIRSCARQGAPVGGWGSYLMRKGFWVTRPYGGDDNSVVSWCDDVD